MVRSSFWAKTLSRQMEQTREVEQRAAGWWCFGISLSQSPEEEEPLETKITGEWGLPSNLGESLKVDDIGKENGEVSSCFFFPIPTISHFPLTFG